MTEEKQQIAIAKACGWKDVKYTKHKKVDIENRSIIHWSGLTGIPPEFIHYQNRIRIPDYLYDLNAMHEAEKVLNRGKNYYQLGGFGFYLKILGQICHQASSVDASAAQRAEAFLCAIGKWKE